MSYSKEKNIIPKKSNSEMHFKIKNERITTYFSSNQQLYLNKYSIITIRLNNSYSYYKYNYF